MVLIAGTAEGEGIVRNRSRRKARVRLYAFLLAASLLLWTGAGVSAAAQEPETQEMDVQGQAGQGQTAQEPAGQESAVQGEAGQEPAGQESAVQEETAQEQAVQEPAGQESDVQEEAVQEPAGQEPAGQEQAVQEPDVQEPAAQTDLGLTARSAILMEAATGRVIYEQNPDERLSPASITKIMTLILIFDALRDGKISLQDEVTTSAYAKSMGGSQVYLEEGEVQTVETLIKCIVIASGNDASVAMAEYIAGSEEEFVRQMNERAKGLGMENTNFEDCCGLTDSPTHVVSARDVAIMSRELVTRYPQVYDYSTIWMENITHVTAQGSQEFGLANTNKLLKTYEGCKGLKTGSTSLAKYCVSATAVRDGVHLIAVVMAAPDYKARFSEAEKLLNHGFASCSLYEDTMEDILLEPVPVTGSLQDYVEAGFEGPFTYLCTGGENPAGVTRETVLAAELEAPVEKGQVIGNITYKLGGQVIGEVPVRAVQDVPRAGYADYLKKLGETLLP